jgi:hypothetical protein
MVLTVALQNLQPLRMQPSIPFQMHSFKQSMLLIAGVDATAAD